MSALLLMTLIIVGIYAGWYPNRATSAEKEFQEAKAERGALTFATNCRFCHGDMAEGGALSGRLAEAPALRRPDLQGFDDPSVTLRSAASATATEITVDNAAKIAAGKKILVDHERMNVKSVDGSTLTVERAIEHTEADAHESGASVYLFDEKFLADKMKLIKDTITCGRVGTAMRPWATEHGGTLNGEQIRQLETLITTGRWDLVEEEVARGDLLRTRLLEPVNAETTLIRFSDVTVFTKNEPIHLGEERLMVTEIIRNSTSPNDKSGMIRVARGVMNSTPLEHDETVTVYKYLPEVKDPTINQSACGQTARAPAPTGSPALIEPFTGQTVEVSALNIAFNTRAISVRTGGQVRVRLNNQDTAVLHNIAFYQSATNLTPVSTGSVGITFPGPDVDDTVFDVPAAGSYYFRCDVHPTIMVGTFTVTP
jgi:plastocyanin